MHHDRFSIIAALTLALSSALTACARAPVTISQQSVAERSLWHASLASPSDLAGAVQVTGTASMGPGSKSGTTDVAFHLGNVSPGGVHPWAMHRGTCANDAGLFGSSDAYEPVTVDGSGKAAATATIPLEPPTSGDYFVVVYASASNMSMTIACGNLAPPTP